MIQTIHQKLPENGTIFLFYIHQLHNKDKDEQTLTNSRLSKRMSMHNGQKKPYPIPYFLFAWNQSNARSINHWSQINPH